MVPHKDPYSVLYYSIYIYVTYSIFFEDLDIASYANDTTIYTVNEKKESVISALDTSRNITALWMV